MLQRLRTLVLMVLIGSWLLIGTNTSTSWAKATLSANDVLVLLQVGYQEAQIIQQIDNAKMRGKFGLQPLQVLQLRKAGASVKLLQVMGIQGMPQPKARPTPITLAELKRWLSQRKSDPWMRKQLLARGVVRSQFDPFAILELNREGLSLALLQLVVTLKKKQPRSAPPQRHPTRRRTPLAVIPPTRTKTTTPQIPAVRPAVRPIARPAVRPAVRRPSLALPPLSAQAKQALREREERVIHRKTIPVKQPKDGLYRHVGRHYTIPIPQGWYAYEDVHPDTGQLILYLTPDANAQLFTIKRGIWISLEYLPHSDRFLLSRSLLQTGRYLLRGLLARETGLRTVSKLSLAQWQGRPSATTTVQGKMSSNQHLIRHSFQLLKHHKALLSMGIFATPKQFATFATVARSALAQLKLRNPHKAQRGKRLTQEQNVQTVIGNNTKGVVSISLGIRRKGKLTFRAAGSGFVVTSNGYVLTNWHVAVNMRTQKPYEEYVLNWDQTTQQPSVKARYIGSHYQWPSWQKVRLVDPQTGRISVRFQRRHVDIALLKIIKPGTYPTVPLSTIRHAMLGDSVIALGFPLEGKGIQDIGNETITATTGRISRMVRMSNQHVNEIQHTAKVAGGNSGGPLFDTATGAVIGINTWVGTFDKRLQRPGMGLGYYYALPIDLGWIYFPDYLDVRSQNLSDIEWLDLGNQWLAAGQLEPAKRAYKRCIKRNPSFTAAYMKLAQLTLQRANQHKDDSYHKRLNQARRWADRGLKHSQHHTGLMRILAQISMLQQQWRTAAFLLQQAIAAHPNGMSLYVMRALLYHLQKDPQRAMQDATQVLRLTGNVLPIGYIVQGNILYGNKRYFEGQRAYRQALKIAPRNLEALIGEARGYTFLKQHTDAVQLYQQIAQTHPYEPDVYKHWMLALLNSDLPKRKLEAWKIFQQLMKSSQLRGTQMDATSLYFGGAIAADVLNPKFRQRVMWGIWGELLAKHTKSYITGQAGFRLAALSLRQRRAGLAHAITRMLSPSLFKTKQLLRAYQRIRRLAKPAGLTRDELLFITLKTYPRWSPDLIWRCFRLTPSLLDKASAKHMLAKGVPPQLVMLMWKHSQKRRKAGVRPTTPHTQPPQKNTNTPQLARQKLAIHRVAQLSFQSLRTGDIDTWMAIHDPGNPTKYQKLFWTFRRSILNGRIVIYPVQKQKIQFIRTPQGINARYYFPMRINQQPTKLYYWQFRIKQRRWVMF